MLTYERLRHNRRIGYALMVCFAILLPTVDPVSLLFEVIPLLILFEASIWLSKIMEKRWGFAADADAGFAGADAFLQQRQGGADDMRHLQGHPSLEGRIGVSLDDFDRVFTGLSLDLQDDGRFAIQPRQRTGLFGRVEYFAQVA